MSLCFLHRLNVRSLWTNLTHLSSREIEQHLTHKAGCRNFSSSRLNLSNSSTVLNTHNIHYHNHHHVDPLSWSLTEASQSLAKGLITPTELTHLTLKHIQSNSHLNAVVLSTSSLALQQAAESDKRYKNGNHLSPLDGIPITLKQLFCTKDIVTDAGSRMLQSFTPPEDATVVSRLYSAGAILVGKTNQDEFGMGSYNLNSIHGPSINPYSYVVRPNINNSALLSTGGSSGGSASAVSSRCGYASLGTDTGGSIRLPASYCGVVGLKPTYGHISRYGVIAYASSLDTPSIMTRTVADARLMLQICQGFDPKDSTSIENVDSLSLTSSPYHNKQSLNGLTVGVPKEYNLTDLDKDIVDHWSEVCEWLKEQGAKIVSVSLPHTPLSLSCYYILAPAEASSNLSRYDGIRYGYSHSKYNNPNTKNPPNMSLSAMIKENRSHGFGEEVCSRIMIGTYVLSSAAYSSYYQKAQQIRRLITNDFINVFNNNKVDVLLTPTSTNVAPTIQSIIEEKKSSVSKYIDDYFTVPANLAGIPAISIPIGHHKKKVG